MTPSPKPAAVASGTPAAKPHRRAVLRDIVGYIRDPLAYLLQARREGGPICRLPLGVINPYLVSDPALIEQVLVSDNKSYSKDFFMRLLGREALGQGLLSSEGDFWRRQRRLAQPAFHRERLLSYGDTMVRCAEEYAARLRPGERRALHHDMMELTLHIVVKTLFGEDATVSTQAVGESLDVLLSRYADNLFLSFPQIGRWPLPMNFRFARGMRQLDDIILSLIARRRASSGERGDLLAMLLSAQDEDGSGMSDKQLRDEVITLFTAGHETTALALSYAFMLLSQHPAVAATLLAELRSVLGPERPGRLPTAADVPALRYCEAVVQETLRLYPPAWILGREAITDTTLAGQPVPHRTPVWISQWVMHRDEAYFPQPERFQPERWLDGLSRRLPRFAYFPFGGGPRLCIGSSFAMTEAILVLATIARRVNLQVEPPQPLVLMPSITLRPKHGLSAVVAAPND